MKLFRRCHPLYLLLLLATTDAWPESGSYQVEVIIFQNLQGVGESEPVLELKSYSRFPSLVPDQLPDFQLEEPGVELMEIPSDRFPLEMIETLPENLSGVTPGILPGEKTDDPSTVMPVPIPDDLPDDLLVQENKSMRMDDVWRRLRSSAEYRPLVFGAWQQNRTDYYPPIRIHDQQIVETQLRPPTAVMIADLSSADPYAAYRSVFYGIDGTVQLRRSRFLHLYLDLKFRQIDDETDLQSDEFQVFSLQQNRQIRTGRMQYFDTPHFGVLVFVSAIKAP